MRIAAVLTALLFASPAPAQQEFTATLAGHALLPARTFVQAPADAPEDLKTSGKYTTGVRVDAVGSVMGRSAGRPTGLALPFTGQPVQGHSGIKMMPDGTAYVLTDNGFGTKGNSPDAMLFFSRVRLNWTGGVIERLETHFLHDPDKKVPFRITHEGTAKRYLTGSDFDPEGMQIINGKVWIGDELGPYIIRADLTGKIEAVFETMVDGKPVRSADHPGIATQAMPAAPGAFTVRRSRGYEGLASSPDGSFLYGLLEGPLWDADKKDWEKTTEGKEYLRILEFDVKAEKWTGRFWRYVLDQNGLAIGDFNMLDASTALIIERDNGEGTADKACPAGTRAETCFHDLAKFKRIVKIEMGEALAGRDARKIAYVDLMKIQDPNNKARKPLNNGVLTFPFFTIENVDRVDATHIVVGNDNNLPFSSSRDPNQVDDNEMVLLEVGAFLNAK